MYNSTLATRRVSGVSFICQLVCNCNAAHGMPYLCREKKTLYVRTAHPRSLFKRQMHSDPVRTWLISLPSRDQHATCRVARLLPATSSRSCANGAHQAFSRAPCAQSMRGAGRLGHNESRCLLR